MCDAAAVGQAEDVARELGGTRAAAPAAAPAGAGAFAGADASDSKVLSLSDYGFVWGLYERADIIRYFPFLTARTRRARR